MHDTWQREEGDGPQSSARLADRIGAVALLASYERGLHDERALAALPWADDAFVVMGRLAELATDRRRTDRERLLRTLVRVVSREPQPVEPLAPDSVARAIAVLDAFSRDRSVANAERALAISALRALARVGYLDRASVTTQLDR